MNRVLVPVGLLLVVAFLVATPTTSAASPSDASCSEASATSATGGIRGWSVTLETGGGCNTIAEVAAGSSFTIYCHESTSGIGPPSAATTLAIRLVADNTDFGSSTPTAIRTLTPSGTSCTEDPETFTAYCTTDGTSTGGAWFGIMRLHVRAQFGGVGSYDVNSDSDTDGLYGIIRCMTTLSSLTESNAQTTYVAGDTIGVTYSAGSATTGTTNTVTAAVLCNAVTGLTAADQLTTSSRTSSTTIKGTNAAWPDDCTLTFKLAITRNSAITGYTSQPYTEFTGTPPSGVTYSGDGLTATRTATKTLDRTLTPGGTCRTELPAGTVRVRIFSGKTITNTCSWTNARSEAAAGLATGYTHRSSQAYTDTTDVPSVATQSFSSGVLTYAPTISTSATDTNGTGALDYVQSVEQYGASRTSGELYNWGNTTGVFDVSRTMDVTDIQLYRNVCGGAYPSTVFWIDHHVVCSREGPVQDPEGNTYTTSLTFTRTYEAWDATSITGNQESGVTSGTSTAHYTVPQETAGTWWFNVTVTDGLGNSGSRSETVTFTATDPGDSGGAVDNDPIKVNCAPTIAWPGLTATCIASAAFLSGLPNSGSAADLPGWFNTTSGTLLSGPVTPTELGTGSGIYAYTYTIPADAPSRAVVLSIAYGADGTRGAGAFFILNDKIATEGSVNTTGTQILATVTGIDGNVSSANNTASGALTQAYFNQWRDGEARPMWITVNGTAREDSLTLLRNNTDTAHGGMLRELNEESFAWATNGWERIRPGSPDELVLFAGAIGLVGTGAIGYKKSKYQATKSYSFIAGLVLAGLYIMTRL